MDFYREIVYSSLLEKLDIGKAFPVVYTLTPQAIEQFVESIVLKLHEKMYTILLDGGEKHIYNDDCDGLSMLFYENGVRLPRKMLSDICKDIIRKSRKVSVLICPTAYCIPGKTGGLYYCKMYIK